MPGLPLLPVYRHPPSPSSPSSLDAPPTIHRCLFSMPLQPPLADVLLPPHHTLSFKMNDSVVSTPRAPVPLLPHCTLSFKINNTKMLDTGNSLHMSFFSCRQLIVFSNHLPARPSELWLALNLTTSVEPIQMGIHPSLPLVAPGCEDPSRREEPPRLEEDTLQEYCQQALLSDRLQQIDK